MSTRLVPANYQAPAGAFTDRVCLVTGAGAGIGQAVAVGLAEAGAQVILLDKNVPAMEQTYDSIEARAPGRAAIYPLDLLGATPPDYHKLAETIEKEYTGLHGLVHCATFLGTRSPMAQFDPELWMKVMQVNLNGPFMLTQAVLGLLRAVEPASVVFSTAAPGRRGTAYWGAYGVSNAALENLMQILADELESNTGIRVNSLDPGAVRTALRLRTFPGEDANQLPKPEDVVPAYLYLLGPDSAEFTGEQFEIKSSGE